MKLSKVKLIYLASLILVTTAGLLWYLNRGARVPGTYLIPRMLGAAQEKEVEKDFQIFQDLKQSPKETEKAVFRLALLQEEHVRDYLLLKLHAAGPDAENAVRGLVFYDSVQVEEVLADLVKNTSASPLRLLVLQYWPQRPSEKRKALLSKLVPESEGWSAHEKFFLKMAILRMTTDDVAKQKLAKELAGSLPDYSKLAASAVPQSDVDTELGAQLRVLLTYLSGEKEVAAWVLGLLRQNQARLENLVLAYPMVARVAIGSLRQLCPTDRYALMEKVLLDQKTPPLVFNSAASELSWHAGPEASIILGNLEKAKKPISPLRLEELKARLANPKLARACQNGG